MELSTLVSIFMFIIMFLAVALLITILNLYWKNQDEKLKKQREEEMVIRDLRRRVINLENK